MSEVKVETVKRFSDKVSDDVTQKTTEPIETPREQDSRRRTNLASANACGGVAEFRQQLLKNPDNPVKEAAAANENELPLRERLASVTIRAT